MKLTPTSAGLAGGPLFEPNSPLNSIICPECPWRKEMTPGYSIAAPNDSSMMQAAKTRTLPVKKTTYFPDGKTAVEYGSRPGAQSCHMILGNRCRGAETFRANIGLDSEVPSNKIIVESEDEAYRVWARRGTPYSKEILYKDDI